jgi:putative addiction module component (TIGR02574 family)
MTYEANELLQKALTLPEADRAELAGNLMDSLDAAVDPNVEAAWRGEAARRRRDIQSGRVKSVAWEEVHRNGSNLLHGK